MARPQEQQQQPARGPSTAELVEALAREIFIILVTSSVGGSRTPESLAETARVQAEAFYGVKRETKEAA